MGAEERRGAGRNPWHSSGPDLAQGAWRLNTLKIPFFLPSRYISIHPFSFFPSCLSILPTYPSIHSSIHTANHLSFLYSFLTFFFPACFLSMIHPSNHPSIHLYILHPYIHPSIHPLIHPPIHPSIHPPTYSSIYPSIHHIAFPPHELQVDQNY